MISRREIIGALLGVAASPFPAFAQPIGGPRRIGVLMTLTEDDPEARRRVAAFQGGLQALGWTDGGNVRIDYRWAGGDAERWRPFAKELVGLKPDVILAYSTPAVALLREETSTIAIVFVLVADPVGSGFVASLAHPGGNVTGFVTVDHTMGGKWLELVKEMAPQLARVALIFNPETAPFYDVYLRSFEAAARSFAVEAIAAPVHDPAGIERAMAALGREPGGGLVVMPDVFGTAHRELIVGLAARYRLPAVYPYRYFAVSGGLVSYGIDTSDLFRRAAAYVDRILKGAKPGELPVQGPSKFELVINLKTAQALGLAVPPSLLGSADEVIE